MQSIELDEKTAAILDRKGYVVQEKIGCGAFGDVFKAISKERHETNAVKVINKEEMEKKGAPMKQLRREIDALMKVRHPNVLQVHDIFQSNGRLYIFMEFASNGDIADQISQAKLGYLTEKVTKHWIRQCVDALHFMHVEEHISHRDIKPENVLIDKHNNAKLCDFGLAREFNVKDQKLSKTFCGSPLYMGPEVLAEQPYNPFRADIWSMGIMLFTMLIGNVPFEVNRKKLVPALWFMEGGIVKVDHLNAWNSTSNICKDLIGKILQLKPKNRISILSVKQHKWLSSETIEVDPKTKAVFDKKGYVVEQKISAGAFGEVYKALNVKRHEMDAVKVMDLGRIEKKGMREEYMDREIKALISVRHPNCLTVHDIFRANGKLYIFMEFAPNGTVKKQLKEAPAGYLSENQSKRWFRQCVDALCCMQLDHHMAHRDIKLDNVLLDAHNNAKLSDFGFAREFFLGHEMSHTYCGTEPYYAPEVLARQPYNPFLYDVWSMGVMLFTMLNGRHPFKIDKVHPRPTLDKMRQQDYNFNPEAWRRVSKDCKELVDSMLTFKPNDRPHILAVRQHRWFA